MTTDLIDREAAVKAVTAERTQSEYFRAQADDSRLRHTDRDLYEVEVRTNQRAIVKIDQLPAHGTCATCRLWARHTGTVLPNKGDCKHPLYETVNEMGCYVPLGWIVTPADHHCAAWQAQEAQP
jgi:hypothetical protein